MVGRSILRVVGKVLYRESGFRKAEDMEMQMTIISGNRISKSCSSQKNSKKGFTLVELIVVLVVLAILAAVAVPVMLGFTDSAREKQYINDAKVAYNSTQTALNDLYNDASNRLDSDKRYSAATLSGINPEKTRFKVWTVAPLVDGETAGTLENIKSFTLKAALYETTNDGTGKCVFYDGNDWKVYDGTDEVESLLTGINCTSANQIHMWPNYSDDSMYADSAYDPKIVAREEWDDATQEDNSNTYTLNIHNYNAVQTKLEPGIIFKNGENETNTPDTLALQFTDDAANGIIPKNWISENTININGTEYTIKYVDGFSVDGSGNDESNATFKWTTEKNPSFVDESNTYTYERIKEVVGQLNSDGIYDIYPIIGKETEERTIRFKCLDDSNALSFTSSNLRSINVTFSRYKNRYDNSDYTRNIKINQNQTSVYTVSDVIKDYNVADNCELGGWAFYQANGTYEKKDGSDDEIKIYAKDVAQNLWEKVFDDSLSEADIKDCAFVGATKKVKKVILLADEKGYSSFNGSNKSEFKAYYNELTGESSDSFGDYDKNQLMTENSKYRIDGWKEYHTISAQIYTLDEVWDIVRKADEGTYIYQAKVSLGSKAKFIARNSSGDTASGNMVGQIYKLFENSRNANKKKYFINQDYSVAVSFLNEAQLADKIMVGYDTSNPNDDEAVKGSNNYVEVSPRKAVSGGTINKMFVMWDGNDPIYSVPIYAYNIVTDSAIYVYWFSQEDHPLLDGGYKGLFYGYKNIDFTGSGIDDWDTSLCTEMSSMFEDSGLTDEKITFTKWDYSSVTTVEKMFKSCTGLHNISFESCSMPVCTNFKNWFEGATALETINFNKLYTPSLTEINSVFNNANKITTFTARGWDAGSIEDNSSTFSLSDLFSGKILLTSIDLSDYSEDYKTDLSRCNSMNKFAKNCSSLRSLSFKNMNLSECTTFAELCNGCTSLVSMNMDGCVTPKLTTVSSMFNNASKLETFTAKGWKAGSLTSLRQFMSGRNKLVTFDINSETDFRSCTDMYQMLNGCSSLQNLSLEDIRLSACTTFKEMCQNCSSLENVNMDNCDTPELKDVTNIFNGASNLKTFTAVGWNAEKLTSLANFMNGKKNLTTFRLSDSESERQETDLSACTSMEKMLYDCSSLGEVSFKGLAINKVNNMNNMLSNCSALTSVSFDDCEMQGFTGTFNPFNNATKNVKTFSARNWDIRGASSFRNLFYRGHYTGSLPDGTTGNVGYSAIQDVDFTGANFSSITDMYYMFWNCSLLKSVSFEDVDFGEDEETINCEQIFFHDFSLESVNFNVKEGHPLRPSSLFKGFDYCIVLRDIDFGLELDGLSSQKEIRDKFKLKFDTSKTTNMGNLFYQCYVLNPENKLYNYFNYESVKVVSRMFYGAYQKTQKPDIIFSGLDLSSIDNSTNAGNSCYGMQQMFTWTNANTVRFEKCNIDGVESLNSMFCYDTQNPKCYPTINTVEFVDCTFNALTRAPSMFNGAEIDKVSFISCDLPKFINSDNNNNIFKCTNNVGVKEVEFIECNMDSFNSIGYLFQGASSIEKVSFNGTSMLSLTTLENKLGGLTNLTEFEAKGWFIPNVTTMKQMFNGRTKLKNVDFSEYKEGDEVSSTNFEKCINMSQMFLGCSKLESVTFADGVDMSNVKAFNKMFSGCTAFTPGEFKKVIGSWNLSGSTVSFKRNNQTDTVNTFINSECINFSEEKSYYSNDGQEYKLGGSLNDNYSFNLYKP